MTRAWLLRRLVGDARRHGVVWVALVTAFAAVGFVAAAAWLAARASAGPLVEPEAHVIAYLEDDLDAPGVAELRRVLATLPGVEEVRAVSARDGLERLRSGLGARAGVLEGVGPDLLAPSLEIVARPAATASALAFRLRRLSGIAAVDLVADGPASATSAAARPGRGTLASGLRTRGPVVVGGALGLLALAAAFGFLRARLRVEVGLLFSLGLTRTASTLPARWLATVAGVAGATLGLVAAALVARAWLGVALLGREAAVAAGALVLVAILVPRLALRLAEAAGAP